MSCSTRTRDHSARVTLASELAITLIGLLLGALAFGVMFLVGNPLSSGPGMEATLPWGHASGLLLGFSAALGLGYACCKDCIGTGSVPPQV